MRPQVIRQVSVKLQKGVNLQPVDFQSGEHFFSIHSLRAFDSTILVTLKNLQGVRKFGFAYSDIQKTFPIENFTSIQISKGLSELPVPIELIIDIW